MRAADAARFRALADLRGRRVGTLGGTIAYEILLAAQRREGVVPVSYDDDVHPYADLAAGRLDAVLLDHIIAARSRQARRRASSIQPGVGRDGPLRRRPREGERGAPRPDRRRS